MTGSITTLYSLEERRLAKLLRGIALAHIRREYSRALELLDEGQALVEWSVREEWKPAKIFLEEWRRSVRREKDGEPLEVAPAAWIHLSQELAHLLDRSDDWISYLHTRWHLRRAKLAWSRRLFFGVMATAALGLAVAIVVLMARALFSGRYDLLLENPFRNGRESFFTLVLMVARVAGVVLMLEHGIHWGRRAILGISDENAVSFLAGEGALTLVD